MKYYYTKISSINFRDDETIPIVLIKKKKFVPNPQSPSQISCYKRR